MVLCLVNKRILLEKLQSKMRNLIKFQQQTLECLSDTDLVPLIGLNDLLPLIGLNGFLRQYCVFISNFKQALNF